MCSQSIWGKKENPPNALSKKKKKQSQEIRLSVSVFICSENGPGATFLGQSLWTIAAVHRREGAEEIIIVGLNQAFSGRRVRRAVPLAS